MPRRITIENGDYHVNYVSNAYSTANDFNNYIRNSYIDNMYIMLTEKNAIDFLKKKGYAAYKKVMETE